MNRENGKILRYVQEAHRSQGSHGIDHVLRVFRLCEQIGLKENADLTVLLPAALLHDIGRRIEEEKGIPHEEAGAQIAGEYLSSMKFGDTRAEKVLHAIRTHRFRSENKPRTLEAMILSDADKLDAMGATGIARTFIRAGERGGGIRDGRDHMVEKLILLKDRMYTGTAEKMAEKRHRSLCSFLDALDEELMPGCTGEQGPG